MSLDRTRFPSHWGLASIESVLFFQEGPGVRKYQYTDEGVKLLNGGNINDGKLDLSTTSRFISDEEAYGKYAHFLVDEGDLLIACSGITVDKFDGKIAYAGKDNLPLCMNTSTMRFKCLDKTKLDIEYFRRFLATPLFKTQLQRLITGSAQLNFGPSHIKQMELPLPPLREQKRIAAILDKADAIRRKRQQAIELADQFLRAVFLDLFGDPVTNPKGWEVRPIGDAVNEIVAGWSANGDSKPAKNDQLGVLKISAVTSGEYLPNENKAVEPKDVPTGRVLVTPTRELVAATALVQAEHKNLFLPDKLWRVQFSNRISPIFFHYLLKHQEVRRRLTAKATGTSGSMLNISKAKFEEFPIIFPNDHAQQRFADQYKKFVGLKSNFSEYYINANRMFSSLSQRAFAGEL